MLLKSFWGICEAHDQVEANEACGFANERVVADPSMFATETPSSWETFEWNVEACEHTFSEGSASEDCSGNQTTLAGTVQYSGYKRETGRPVTRLGFHRVNPETYDALRYQASALITNDFEMSHSRRDENAEMGEGLRILNGSLSGTYAPIRGLSEIEEGSFNIPTPVARFEEVRGQDVSLELRLA